MAQDDERKYTCKHMVSNCPYIRLLKLYPGKDEESLQGRLDRVSLESTKTENTFVALSYVWGKGLKLYIVTVSDQKTIRITASLYFALKRIRKEKYPTWVWEDAICIDQSNEEERGHQVRLMKSIYSSATRVCAWLGEETDGSDAAVDCLRGIRTSSDDSRRGAQSSARPSTVSLPETDHSIWDSIKKFFGRAWFKRVWMVQELVLAENLCANAAGKLWRGKIFTSRQLYFHTRHQDQMVLYWNRSLD